MTSRVEYTGNGATRAYSVSFPYIEKAHVVVYLDGIAKAVTADYVWSSDSTITFNTAPGNGAIIVLQRETPTTARLVTFTDGANLVETDLNLDSNQLFYISQETLTALQRMIEGSYTAPTAALVQSVAESVLNTATAIEIQQRVTDIDTAGENILDLMDWRNVLGSLNAGRTAFVLDTDNIYIDSESGDTIAARLSILAAADTSIAASVVSEASIRSSADGALQARYGVSLNVNGFITGFVQNNNGTSGTFDILTNKFRVVDPGPGAGATPTVVFDIESGNVLLKNLYLDHLILGAAGAISVGKSSAASTTNGLWLGTDGSTHYDFHIGDVNSYLKWDGSAASLTISGSLLGTFSMPGSAHSSITPSYTGWSSNPTRSLLAFSIGSMGYVYVGSSGSTGTSNSATFTVGGWPADPLNTIITQPFLAVDNGNNVLCVGSISTGGTLTVSRVDGTAFTASGTKGFLGGSVIAFPYPSYQWA